METKEEINQITKRTENFEIEASKHKLKDLFKDIDQENKTKKITRKNNTAKSNNNIEDEFKNSKSTKTSKTKNIQKEYDDTIKKTKPTKPDFTQQYIDNGIIGLKQKNTYESSIQYKGLINFGNICYSNVVIQCLIALNEFVVMLKTIFNKLEDLDGIDIDKTFPVLSNLVKIQNFYESNINFKNYSKKHITRLWSNKDVSQHVRFFRRTE
jgi:ubiquitin C-terminal hydrolase